MVKGRFKENINLRKAVYSAIDREAMAKTLGGISACYWVGEGQLGYDAAAVACDKYDPAKAKQYLTDAGFPNGVDIIINGKNDEIDRPQGEILKSMLDKVRIRTTIDLMERLALVAKRSSGEGWDLSLIGAYYNVDPGTTFATRLATGGAGNYAGWSDPEFDKCAEEGMTTYDEAERHKTYVRCQNIAFEKAPATLLWTQRPPVALSNNVQGTRRHWLFMDFWGELWLKK